MFDRAQIMKRAWAIFRATYNYPAVPFRSIGRPCFAWALRRAWQEAQATAAMAAIPVATRQECAAGLRDELAFLNYRDDYRAASARGAAIKAELAHLTV